MLRKNILNRPLQVCLLGILWKNYVVKKHPGEFLR